jgi:hypothetical protein
VWEPLWFSVRARLIAGLGQQPRRVKRQAHYPLIGGKVTSAHIGDLVLVTAMHKLSPALGSATRSVLPLSQSLCNIK